MKRAGFAWPWAQCAVSLGVWGWLDLCLDHAPRSRSSVRFKNLTTHVSRVHIW